MRYTTNFPTVRGDETVLVQGMASRMSPSTSFGTGAGIAVGTCGNSGSKTLWKNWTIGKLWNNRFQTSWSSDLSKVKKHNKGIFFTLYGGREQKHTSSRLRNLPWQDIVHNFPLKNHMSVFTWVWQPSEGQ